VTTTAHLGFSSEDRLEVFQDQDGRGVKVGVVEPVFEESFEGLYRPIGERCKINVPRV
jgi:hypothetical protein